MVEPADLLGICLTTLCTVLFALSGAQLAEKARLSPLIVVLIGTMTGVVPAA